MRIAFANDHAALNQRGEIVAKLKKLGHEVVDFGVHLPDSVDYPNYAARAAIALQQGKVDRAILMCGTGIGMSIAANRFRGVRCALATDVYGARMSRLHNDANCLALRAREQALEMNNEIVDVWLTTDFEGGRHQVRVDKIETNAHAAHSGGSSEH